MWRGCHSGAPAKRASPEPMYTGSRELRQGKCSWVPVVPLLGIASCLLLMFSLPVENWYRLIIWLVIGLVIYFAYGRNHSVMAQQRQQPQAVKSGGR